MNVNDFLIREAAAAHLASQIPKGSRLVITGATGWLGRTLVGMLLGSKVDLFLVGSHERFEKFFGTSLKVNEFNLEVIRDFAPTAIFDFGFVTREYILDLGLERYLEVNTSLIERALRVFELPSVNLGLFTSSGAAVAPHFNENMAYVDNPYGFLKRKTENLVGEASRKLNKRALVIRPWSLSGPLTEKTDSFAFSSFIHQSSQGKITVRSQREVFRRYISADDFLSVSTSLLFGHHDLTSPFDSGGDLISAQALANSIADASSIPVQVDANVDPGLDADSYFSDNVVWLKACEVLGYVPETLEEQIQRNLRTLNY